VIVYFDSSSIVKWFFDEPNTELAREIRDKANLVFTSIVSFPEVMSAIYRARREGRCSKSDMELVRGEFSRIWPGFHWIRVNDILIQQAGQLIFRYGLRGYDSIHLASGLALKAEDDGIEVFFSCFDRNLNRAALKEGLAIHREIG
jgi:predicted nucleic acid-binding protein